MAKIMEYVKIAIMNIKSNKGRSFLTMLGIVIGISSVILIVSAGNGIKNGISGQLDDLVGGYIEIYSYANDENGNAVNFNKDDINLIVDEIEHVKGATDLWTFSNGTAQSTKGTFEVSATFGNEYLQYYNTSPLVKGRYFTRNEYEKGSKVCVITEKSAQTLFGSTNVIGMNVNYNLYGVTQEYTIVGIRRDSDSASGVSVFGSDDVEMEIPTTVLESAYGYSTEQFSEFYIFSDSSEYVQSISKRAKSILEARYNVRGQDLIDVFDYASSVDSISQILDYITILVVLVAAISLIVGGIGVMNIMLVSVTERTKEIGIRKALGAKTGSILFQFLMEAVIITLIGGLLGIILGILGANGVCIIVGSLGMGNVTAVVEPKVVISATAFSSLIGIFFGIYPARKAAKLSPIEALRHE